MQSLFTTILLCLNHKNAPLVQTKRYPKLTEHTLILFLSVHLGPSVIQKYIFLNE